MNHQKDNDVHYSVKIHMRTGTVTAGPYDSMEEAERMAVDITFGDVNSFDLQNGGHAVLSTQPEYVEILPFRYGPVKRFDEEELD